MILASGPTGHVGAPLLEALAGGSDPVRGLVRGPESAEQVSAAGAEPVTGNLDDAAWASPSTPSTASSSSATSTRRATPPR